MGLIGSLKESVMLLNALVLPAPWIALGKLAVIVGGITSRLEPRNSYAPRSTTPGCKPNSIEFALVRFACPLYAGSVIARLLPIEMPMVGVRLVLPGP